ncbi:MAG: hypothetical protein Q9225_002969 [Loekoesia sp. 1 TL-2023]
MDRQPQQSTTDRLPFQQLLKHNDLAIIENPLRRIPEDHLNAYIQSFHDEFDLVSVTDIDTLIRGARLARDEEAFVAEETAERSLTKVEIAALQREKSTSIWTESREIKIILLTCCIGSIVQGWVSEPCPLRSRLGQQTASCCARTTNMLTRGRILRLRALSLAQTRHGQENLAWISAKTSDLMNKKWGEPETSGYFRQPMPLSISPLARLGRSCVIHSQKSSWVGEELSSPRLCLLSRHPLERLSSIAGKPYSPVDCEYP